jgi:flagellar biosynthesis/type III secretory pathway M-ring protein FliF/YscJ
LKKYQFDYEFDLEVENSKIGYYHNKIKEKKNNTFKYILFSILIIVLSGILIVLGIFVGKYFFKLRKKRANELDDDDYEYKQKNEGINNILENE